MPPMPAAPPPAMGGDASSPVLSSTDEALDLAVVKSPIVGTFYRSPEPGAKPYAEVGDTVRKGQVICIIEALKMMNEINAHRDDEVVKCYVEKGEAVQHGERMIAVKPS